MQAPARQLPLADLAARLAAASAGDEASLGAFWARHRLDVGDVAAPLDRALLGGAGSARVAWAFASGYQAALCALLPAHEPARLAALCVTEAGGAHPRAVRSELRPAERGGYALSGHKRWATTAPDAGLLYVVAREGLDAEGRPRLRVAAVDAGRAGVRLEPMPPPPFAPELPHAEVFLEQVEVAEAELLPGDGYTAYVRPFRTVEDLHVSAALLGYLWGAARRHAAPAGVLERIWAASVGARALALEAPTEAATHLALAGLLATVRQLLDEVAAQLGRGAADLGEHARLVRDAALLGVAAQAREQRRANAWAALGGGPSVAPAPEPRGGA